MSRVVPIALITLLLSSCLPMVSATNGRAVNVDLDVTDIDYLSDSTNQSLFQMFSSNYPIPGFNKPEMLYVTDGVVGVEMNKYCNRKSRNCAIWICRCGCTRFTQRIH